jgi:hypothetical protein
LEEEKVKANIIIGCTISILIFKGIFTNFYVDSKEVKEKKLIIVKKNIKTGAELFDVLK